MSELFEIEESKSPRILWLEKHNFGVRNYSDGQWYAFRGREDAWGQSEDEVVTQLALKLGIKLWNEEGGRP